MCRYYYKNKCHILNPAYTWVVNQRLEMFFESRIPQVRAIVTRTRDTLQILSLATQPVLPYKTP